MYLQIFYSEKFANYKKSYTFAPPKTETHSVTVAHQILVLFVGVRIPVGLHF